MPGERGAAGLPGLKGERVSAPDSQWIIDRFSTLIWDLVATKNTTTKRRS